MGILIERSMRQMLERITDSYTYHLKEEAHFWRSSITNRRDPHYWLHKVQILFIPDVHLVHKGSLVTSEFANLSLK
jgi:hypothetical protein